jgi:hypothetical protein
MGLLRALLPLKRETETHQPDIQKALTKIISDALTRIQHHHAPEPEVYPAMVAALREHSATYTQVQSVVMQLSQRDTVLTQRFMRSLGEDYGWPTPVTAKQSPLTVRQPEHIVPEQLPAAPLEPPPAETAETYHELCSTRADLIIELASTHHFGAMVVGASKTGTTTALKTFAYAWAKWHAAGPHQPTIQIHDLECEQWSDLDHLPNLVSIHLIEDRPSLEAFALVIDSIAAEIKRRQNHFRNLCKSPLAAPTGEYPPALYLINGWQEAYALFSGLTKTTLKSDDTIQKLCNQVRYCLKYGPKFAVSVALSSESHSAIHPDTESLAGISLFAIGRLVAGGSGGYSAISKLLDSAALLPAKNDRIALRDIVTSLQQHQQPVVVSTCGQPRVSLLPDYSRFSDKKIAALLQGKIE